ncbi:GNAT family N-acetyltransferase [endosymbiont of Lamellibrachia barhami]|uniref:GNAT family N-acetyltransferase n=1 Tax=endosymbiont of Lamellibrachia barhami TaxID=205975 RepID=UPI0015ADE08F|nr:GNAT family N-acetyltransferase [endosymbiont of Lamellibrachia barhami]
MIKLAFQIRIAHWSEDQVLLKQVREIVFVHEQHVPPTLEWDGLDEGALHLLAVERGTGEPIGTSRLLRTGQIGRMAVIRSWRGRGVGKALLQKLLVIADQNSYPGMFLNAQSTALSFYAQHGFVAEGDEFMDAGIPHRRMTKEPLNNA